MFAFTICIHVLGIWLKLPKLHSIRKLDMREMGIEIDDIVGYTRDNVPVYLNGTLFVRVIDAELACYSV